MVDRAEIITRFTGDNTDLREKLEQLRTTGGSLQASFDELKASIISAVSAGAAIRAIINTVRDMADLAHSIENMSRRVGMNIETVQTLGLVWSRAGLSIENVEQLVLRMDRAIAEASAGSKEHARAFQALGLSYKELANLTTDQRLEAITRALANSANEAEASAAAYKIFGREAGRSLELLASVGEQSLSELRETAVNNFQVMREETVKNLSAIKQFWFEFGNVGKTVTGEIIGALSNVFAEMGRLTVSQKVDAQNLELIERSMKSREERQKKIAEAQAAEAEALNRQKELAQAIAEQEKVRQEIAEKTKTNQQKLRDVIEEIQRIENTLAQYSEAQRTGTAEGVRLQTQLLKLSQERTKIEEAIAKELLPAQKQAQEEMRRLAQELNAEREKAKSLEDKLNQRLYERWFKGLSNEQKLNELTARRQELIERITGLVEFGNEKAAEYFETQLKIVEVDEEIERVTKQIAENSKDIATSFEKLTAEDGGLSNLGKLLLKLSDKEIARLIENLNKLREPIKGLDNIALPDLSKLALPKEMVDPNVKQKLERFAAALLAFTQQIRNLDFGNLAKLGEAFAKFGKQIQIPEWMLRGDATFRINNFVHALKTLLMSLPDDKKIEHMARFGEAFGKLSGGLNIENAKALGIAASELKKFELPKIELNVLEKIAELLKASANAKFGSLAISLDVPKDGIKIDTRDLKLDKIAYSLEKLANLEGIVWY